MVRSVGVIVNLPSTWVPLAMPEPGETLIALELEVVVEGSSASIGALTPSRTKSSICFPQPESETAITTNKKSLLFIVYLSAISEVSKVLSRYEMLYSHLVMPTNRRVSFTEAFAVRKCSGRSAVFSTRFK